MSQIFRIPLDETWVDINTITGISVSTNAISIVVEGVSSVYITESATQPTNPVEGVSLTNKSKSYASIVATSTSGRLWAKAASPTGSIISVQEDV